jgi:hypothetical protein
MGYIEPTQQELGLREISKCLINGNIVGNRKYFILIDFHKLPI